MSSKALTLIIDSNNSKLKNSEIIEKSKFLKDYDDMPEESDDDDDNIDFSLDTMCSLDMTYENKLNNSLGSNTKSTTTVTSSNSSLNRSKLKTNSKQSFFTSQSLSSSIDIINSFHKTKKSTKKPKKKPSSKEKLQLFFNLLAKLVEKFNKSFQYRSKKSLRATSYESIHNILYYKKNLKKKLFILSFIKTFKQFENASKIFVELFTENELLSENESILYNDLDNDENECLLNSNVNASKIKNKKNKKIRPEMVKIKNLESNPISPLSSSISILSSISSTENTSRKFVDRKKRYVRQNSSINSSSSSSSSSSKLNDIKYESVLDSELDSTQKKFYKKKLNFKLNAIDHQLENDQNIKQSTSYLLHKNGDNNTSANDLLLINNNLINKCNKYEQNIKSLSQELNNIKRNNEFKEFKLMARSEYEALKLQLNTFREDYRMEHNEKVHLRIYYEEKLRNLESSNTELTNKLNKLILLSEAYESYDSTMAKIL